MEISDSEKFSKVYPPNQSIVKSTYGFKHKIVNGVRTIYSKIFYNSEAVQVAEINRSNENCVNEASTKNLPSSKSSQHCRQSLPSSQDLHDINNEDSELETIDFQGSTENMEQSSQNAVEIKETQSPTGSSFLESRSSPKNLSSSKSFEHCRQSLHGISNEDSEFGTKHLQASTENLELTSKSTEEMKVSESPIGSSILESSSSIVMDVNTSSTSTGDMQMSTESIKCPENCKDIKDQPSTTFNTTFSTDGKEHNKNQEECMSVDSNDSYNTAVSGFDFIICDTSNSSCVSSILLNQSAGPSNFESNQVPWIISKFYDQMDRSSYDMSFPKDQLYLPPEIAADNEIGRNMKRKRDCDSTSPDGKVSRIKFDHELSQEKKEYYRSRNLSTDVLSRPRTHDGIRVEEGSLNIESTNDENLDVSIESLDSNLTECQFGSEEFDLVDERNSHEIQDKSKSDEDHEASYEFSELKRDFQFGSKEFEDLNSGLETDHNAAVNDISEIDTTWEIIHFNKQDRKSVKPNFQSDGIKKPIGTLKTLYRADYPVYDFRAAKAEPSINELKNDLLHQINKVDKSFLSQSSKSNAKNETDAEAYFKDNDIFSPLYKDFSFIQNMGMEEALYDANAFNEQMPIESELEKYKEKQQNEIIDQETSISEFDYKRNNTNNTAASLKILDGLQKYGSFDKRMSTALQTTNLKETDLIDFELGKYEEQQQNEVTDQDTNVSEFNYKSNTNCAKVSPNIVDGLQKADSFDKRKLMASQITGSLNVDDLIEIDLEKNEENRQNEITGQDTKIFGFNYKQKDTNSTAASPQILDDMPKDNSDQNATQGEEQIAGTCPAKTSKKRKRSSLSINTKLEDIWKVEKGIKKPKTIVTPLVLRKPSRSIQDKKMFETGYFFNSSRQSKPNCVGKVSDVQENPSKKAKYQQNVEHDSSGEVSTTENRSSIKHEVELNPSHSLSPPIKDNVRRVFEVNSPSGMIAYTTSQALSPIHFETVEVSKARFKNRSSLSKSSFSKSKWPLDRDGKTKCTSLGGRRSFLCSNEFGCDDDVNREPSETSNVCSKPCFSEIGNKSMEEVNGIKEGEAVKGSSIRRNPSRISKDKALALLNKI